MAAQYFTFGVPLTADQLGQPGGPASLGASGRAPVEQMPFALEEAAGTVATRYLGAIDDAAALSSGGFPLQAPGPVWQGSARVPGSYFVVTAAGTTAATVGDIPAGTPLAAGARVVSTGTAWAYDEALRYVATRDLFDDAVTTAKIAAGAVTAAELADDAVTTAKIAAGAVGFAERAGVTRVFSISQPNINIIGAATITGANTTYTNLVRDVSATILGSTVYCQLSRTAGTGAATTATTTPLMAMYRVPEEATAWVAIRWSVNLTGAAASEGGISAQIYRAPSGATQRTLLATLALTSPTALDQWLPISLNMSGVTAVPGDEIVIQSTMSVTRSTVNTTLRLRRIEFELTTSG